MKFDKKSELVSLRLDIDELSPLMLHVANAMINNDTIHANALYWISTHRYEAYRRMMDTVGITSIDITISRQQAERLRSELTVALDPVVTDTSITKVARICVECHKGYVDSHECVVSA